MAVKVHTFDTSTFTVGGETLTSYEADIDTDPDYTPDHEVVLDGYFHESGEGFRSAPLLQCTDRWNHSSGSGILNLEIKNKKPCN